MMSLTDCEYLSLKHLFPAFSLNDAPKKSFFGNPRILSLWDELIASPMLRDFAWSPLVQAAVSRNFALLQPESAKDLYDAHSPKSLSGLLALHLRRGDYKQHCPNLAEWGADYMGISQHPALPDRFDRSPYENDTDAKLSYYLDHCWPSTEQVVEKLRDVKAEYPELRRVYVLSNAGAWSLDALKSTLKEDGWEDLVSSTDIVLDSEQKYVAMAVDMAIAEKAEVFVGNGVSVFYAPARILIEFLTFVV
jgi:FMN phosphatase YigB (HAD superfamily)